MSESEGEAGNQNRENKVMTSSALSVQQTTEHSEAMEKKRRESCDASVETAEEVAADDCTDIAGLTREMFQKITVYLQGDLAATAEDYRLLEQMNMVTAKKYTDMKTIAMQIGDSMTDLQSKYQSLQPYLDQIDQVEESVASLEQAALRLDAYSKRLEAKFKQLEKR